jgi:hypothetical protein
MDLEQQLKETYAERLGGVDLTGGDPAAARRTGARMRVRRRVAVGATAVAVVALAAGGSLLGTDRISTGPSGSTGEWRELPAAPLSPRANAQAVWTGAEVLVVGGEEHPCPPGADCAAVDDGLRDGAAYDPGTDSWHPIADAPVPVMSGDRLVAAGGEVVLRHWRQDGSDWFSYDPEADDWSRIPNVPDGVGDLPSAIGPDVYAMVGHRVAVYSVPRSDWTLLPPDPIEPALAQRVVTATDVGPVVTGVDATQPNDGHEPSLLLADVWDGSEWRRLPPSEQLAGNSWSWTGTRMVDPEPFTLDGGQVDGWGRSYPMGGTLDPATGTWGPLPDALVNAPQGDDRGWVVSAADGRWIAVLGQVYDDSTGQVTRLSQPAGAPAYGIAGAWADDRLVAFGGTDFKVDQGCRGPASVCDQVDLSNHAWLWTP